MWRPQGKKGTSVERSPLPEALEEQAGRGLQEEGGGSAGAVTWGACPGVEIEELRLWSSQSFTAQDGTGTRATGSASCTYEGRD